jgi:uncharacterized protein YbjT (DUF2867 family)
MTELRSGPVAVTGASGQVGTLLRKRLAEHGNETRPLNRGDDWTAGIHSAAVVVHLAGTLQPKGGSTYESANVETTRTVASAAAAAGVSRIVFLSYVGADTSSSNAYLRAKGEAEEILGASGTPATIFRCLHIYGPPERPGPTAEAFIAEGKGRVTVLGSGRQQIAPLYIGDVAEAVVRAALDPDTPVGTFELGGPDEMSMDDFVRALNGGEARIVHLPAPIARMLGHLVPALTPALVDLLIRDNVTSEGSGRTAAELGLRLRRLEEVWGGQKVPDRPAPGPA